MDRPNGIDAKTALYGILGNPVKHSLSPLLHNSLFKKNDINAVYLAFEVGPGSLGLAFEAVRALSIRGVNLTVPFKEEAMDYVDEVPEDVDRRIDAINTVVNRDGRLYGYNTDGRGFLVALREELKLNPSGKKVLVLGAGGASRGVVFALAQAHAERILILNRNSSRAQGLGEYASEYFEDVEIRALSEASVLERETMDLVVNATSAGLNADDAPPLDLKAMKKPGAVMDLVYGPADTSLLKAARALSVPCANGLGMLAAQAAYSFELWTGKNEGVLAAMKEVLKAWKP